MGRTERDAFVMVPLGYGSLAPGAVGAMLEHARESGLEGRSKLLASQGFDPDPEGDVILICCAKDDALEFGNQIVAAVGEPGTISGDER